MTATEAATELSALAQPELPILSTAQRARFIRATFTAAEADMILRALNILRVHNLRAVLAGSMTEHDEAEAGEIIAAIAHKVGA